MYRRPIYSGDEEVGYIIFDDDGTPLEERYFEDDA